MKDFNFGDRVCLVGDDSCKGVIVPYPANNSSLCYDSDFVMGGWVPINWDDGSRQYVLLQNLKRIDE